MNFDDDSMSLDELRDIVSHGGKRAEPVHVNVEEEKFLKSLGNPGAINTPLADYGRKGDTEIVYANQKEQELLKARGGSGTINPKTGLTEYDILSDLWHGWTGAISKLWNGVDKVIRSVGQIAKNTIAAIKRDPLEELTKIGLTIVLGPEAALIPNTFITYAEAKKHGMSDGDALRAAGTGAAVQYAGQAVVKTDWYKANVGGAAASLGVSGAASQAAVQKIIDGAASSAVSSLVASKLANSKDPWGDILKGGLAGGVSAGATLGLDYANGNLTDGTLKSVTSSDTFKNAYAAAIRAGVLKQPIETAIAGSLVTSFTRSAQKWIKDTTSVTNDLKEKNTASDAADAKLTAEQKKAKDLYAQYQKDDASFQNKGIERLRTGMSIVDDFNALADAAIQKQPGLESRDKVFSLLSNGLYEIKYTDPSGRVVDSTTLLPKLNEFTNWYTTNEPTVTKLVTDYGDFKDQATSDLIKQQNTVLDTYADAAKANAAVDTAGANYLDVQAKNTDYLSDSLNAIAHYQNVVGADISEKNMNSILNSYNPDKPQALLDTAFNLAKTDYAAVNPGKTLDYERWDAEVNPEDHFSAEEVKAMYANEGITNPTQEQIEKFQYQYKDDPRDSYDSEAYTTESFRKVIDASYTTNAEIQELFFNNLGRGPTPDELSMFAGKPEQDVKTATQDEASVRAQKLYAEDMAVTDYQEATDFAKRIGIKNPTLEQLQVFTGLPEAGSFAIARLLDDNYLDGELPSTQDIKALAAKYKEDPDIFKEALDFDAAQYARNIIEQEPSNLLGYSKDEADLLIDYLTRGEEAGVDFYTDNQSVTRDEAKKFLMDQGITNPSEDMLNQFIRRGRNISERQVVNDIKTYADPLVTTREEAIAQFKAESGGVEPTSTQLKVLLGYVGQKDEEDQLAAIKTYADTNTTTEQEVRDEYAKYGLTPTDADIAKFTKLGVESKSLPAITKYVDPLYTDEAEVIAEVKKVLGANVSQEIIDKYVDQFVGATKEKDQLTALKTYANTYDNVLTRTLEEDVREEFAKYGLTPTAADIAKFTKMGEAKSLPAITKYVDPLYTDEAEVVAAVKKVMGKNVSQEILDKYVDEFVGPTKEKDQLINIANDAKDHYVTDKEFTAAFKAQYGINPTADLIKQYIGYTGDLNQADKFKADFQKIDPSVTTKAEIDAKFKEYGQKPTTADYKKFTGLHSDDEIQSYLDTKYPKPPVVTPPVVTPPVVTPPVEPEKPPVVEPEPPLPPPAPVEPPKPVEPPVVTPPVEPPVVTPPVEPPKVEPEKPPVVEPETPLPPPAPVEPPKPVEPPVVTPPVEPPVVTPPVEPPKVEEPPTPEPAPEPVYTFDEVGNVYKDGTLYRTADSTVGAPVEGDAFTTDSKGNIFKNGTLYRTAESAQGGEEPTYDPAKVKPVAYKSPAGKPITPKPTTPTTPAAPKTPEFDPAAYLAATKTVTAPQKAAPTPVVQATPYFDISKKFDPGGYDMSTSRALPGIFGDDNPIQMYGARANTNTSTNQPRTATMATGGYLGEEPMDMKEILNILERG